MIDFETTGVNVTFGITRSEIEIKNSENSSLPFHRFIKMSLNQPTFTLNHPAHFKLTPFGSANFTTEDEARKYKLSEYGSGNKHCPYIGIMTMQYNKNGLAIYARKPFPYQINDLSQEYEPPDGNGHLLTVAPTRAGKGTGQIIPNLLTWQGSVLVIDIKGENYLRSAGYREKKLNQKVLRFAPFEKVSDIWNPILSIHASPDTETKSNESTPEEEEDARYLTNLLITLSGSSDAAFWENSAKNFLEGLLLYVRTAPLTSANLDSNDPEHQYQLRERSMREVRRLLSLKKKAFKKLLTAMGETKRPIIVQAGNNLSRLMSGNSKTGQSILAMALEQTAVWAYQRLHKVTYKKSEKPDDLEPAPNDFSFEQMRDGNTSIYLIIPPDYLTEYRAVLRVMIGFAMRELRQSFVKHKKDDEYKEKPPVLFILDEFPQLAYMRPIEEALLYLAGYDVRFWFFVQDISQLQLHYKNSWQTFFANTGTQCFFGVSDIATASLVSEIAGITTTQHTTHHNNQVYPPHSYTTVTLQSTTINNNPRQLITPDEVMGLQENEQIIFIKGINPIRCDRPNYYEFSEINERSNIKPLHEVDFF